MPPVWSFSRTELAGFVRDHERGKVVEVLRKTWKKMSPAARDLALAEPLDPDARTLLGEALG